MDQQNYVVGIGEVLWDILPDGKKNRRCSGKFCLSCFTIRFAFASGECHR